MYVLGTLSNSFMHFSFPINSFLWYYYLSLRSGSGNSSGSKACREKLRRDRLNDRHLQIFHALSMSLLSWCFLVLSVLVWSLSCNWFKPCLKVPRIGLCPWSWQASQNRQGCHIKRRSSSALSATRRGSEAWRVQRESAEENKRTKGVCEFLVWSMNT